MSRYNSIYFNIIRKKKGKRGKGSPMLKIFLVGFLSVSGLMLFSFFAFRSYVLSSYKPYFKDPASMLAYKIDALTFLDRNGQIVYQTPGRYTPKLTNLKDISTNMINATLAAEDKHFFKHFGISWEGTFRAVYRDLEERDIYKQGGSTITQQIARNIFLNTDKSIIRKLKEVVLAIEIENSYTKEEILTLYLNSVYFGSGAYGIEAASKTYFGKKPSELSIAESSLLAGLVASPSRFSPHTGDKEQALKRQSYVLNELLEGKFINSADYQKAKKTVLAFVPYELPNSKAPHFVLYLKEQLRKQFPETDIDKSGFTIHTTLDLTLQERAKNLVVSKVQQLQNRNVTNGAFVSLEPKTGKILAMVGSVDYNAPGWGAVNILTSYRSPGSAIKPLVYAAAFEKGKLTTATILKDEKTTYRNEWETYTPTDSDGKFRGSVSPRRALSNSLNIPAVQVASFVGVPTILDTMQKFGISGLRDSTNYGLSIGVGGLELKGIELAASYGVLANQGIYTAPFGIEKVTNKFGEKIFEAQNDQKKVLDPRTAYILTNILSDNKARSELFGPNNPLDIKRPAAVKTGTGQDFKNTWTVGYTENLLTLVWFGNNDQSPMREIWGLESAALVWNRFMTETLAGSPPEQFTVPSGLETADVCQLDGSKAIPGQPTSKEIFLTGTVPNNLGACAFMARKRDEEEKARIQLASLENSEREAALSTASEEDEPTGTPHPPEDTDEDKDKS